MVSNGPLGQILQRDKTEPLMAIVLQAQPDTFGVITFRHMVKRSSDNT